MINSQIATRFRERFSVVPVRKNKSPIGVRTWEEYQEIKIEKDLLNKIVDNNEVYSVGLITGYDYLEVIDVDLKVFSTTTEKNDFWNEYLGALRESIYDFDNKFVLYKTISGGYHILYKSKRVEPSKKIAILKGHKQAVIETKGRFGYVVAYPDNKVTERTYFDVDFITDEDREILWNISKAYNHEEPKEEPIKKATKAAFKSDGLTPWEDFNNQINIIDIVCPDDFYIPKGGYKSKYTLIKRHGSSAAHSGYVFKDTGCLYLFSTGTQYPHETLISPYHAYTIKNHNGDFSASAKDLYEQGFGDRIKHEELKPIIKEKPVVEDTEFPIDVFPEEIQFYIKECADKLQMNVDYMGCSLLWLISVICGNSFEIEVKTGWREKGVLWLSLVGQAGVGKTPSIDRIIYPLQKINKKQIKQYLDDRKKFDEFESLTKKERNDLYGENYVVEKPKKTQFIVNDITLEALVDMHQENDNAVGVFKDELAGWLKDMNKYRAGSDLEFWLSTWSGKSVNVNRMSRAGSFVDKPFIPVLGGIQPSIFNNLNTEETKENGFVDRILMSYPNAKADYYVDAEMDYAAIQWYEEIITKFFYEVKKNSERKDGEIVPTVVKLTGLAKEEWVRIFNDITDKQNNDEENQYLKSMYPKQKSYVPRFALLINVMKSFFRGWQDVEKADIDSILKAEKLSNYFVNNAKKIKIDKSETDDIKSTLKDAKTTVDKIKLIYKEDPKFNRTKVAELMGISRRQVINIVKKIEENV